MKRKAAPASASASSTSSGLSGPQQPSPARGMWSPTSSAPGGTDARLRGPAVPPAAPDPRSPSPAGCPQAPAAKRARRASAPESPSPSPSPHTAPYSAQPTPAAAPFAAAAAATMDPATSASALDFRSTVPWVANSAQCNHGGHGTLRAATTAAAAGSPPSARLTSAPNPDFPNATTAAAANAPAAPAPAPAAPATHAPTKPRTRARTAAAAPPPPPSPTLQPPPSSSPQAGGAPARGRAARVGAGSASGPPRGVPEKLGDQPLRLIVVGHNPSAHAWQSGHYYSHPANHMWRLLIGTGIAPAGVRGAEDDDRLPGEAGVGFLDVGCGHPGTDSSSFKSHVFEAWSRAFYARLRAHMARAAASVGCTCGRCAAPSLVAFSGKRHFLELLNMGRSPRDRIKTVEHGPQRLLPSGWPFPAATTEVWVCSSTSGAAAMTRQQREEPWRRLAERMSRIEWPRRGARRCGGAAAAAAGGGGAEGGGGGGEGLMSSAGESVAGEVVAAAAAAGATAEVEAAGAEAEAEAAAAEVAGAGGQEAGDSAEEEMDEEEAEAVEVEAEG